MFHCKRLSEECLRDLASAGFVHITDLVLRNGESGTRGEMLLGVQVTQEICVPAINWGRWDTNNGVMTLVTPDDGQVWVCRLSDSNRERAHNLAWRLCPKGKGVYVHCSNGEHLSTGDLLERLSDPYSGCCFKEKVK